MVLNELMCRVLVKYFCPMRSLTISVSVTNFENKICCRMFPSYFV